MNNLHLLCVRFRIQSAQTQVKFGSVKCASRSAFFLAAPLLATVPLEAQSSLAPTPPTGWNSWNHFAEKVDDKTIRETADLMVSTGMRDACYLYVNIDDTWQGKRDAQGHIHSNGKFPDMKALADYVHSKGLKLGIYSGPGEQTYAGYEASLGYESRSTRRCMTRSRTDRPIVLSLCQYGWEVV